MSYAKERPLITFALFAYNQEQFIVEAVQGAFRQTYSPLEIILSDDCSPDRTFEIMQEMAAAYHGPHTVILNRNQENLGLIGHINRVMEMAQGELVVVAAGDDISRAERVNRIHQMYIASNQRAMSIFSNAIWIDEHGCEMNPLHKKQILQGELSLENYAARRNPGFVNGATSAWHRSVFDFFGPLPRDVGAEDTTIPFRATLLGEIRYIHEPLVYYRRDITRVKNTKQHYSFKQYRRRWEQSRQVRIATFRCRLRDIDIYQAGYLDKHVTSLSRIKRITQEHIKVLEDERPKVFSIWAKYAKMVLYFQYQHLHRSLRKRQKRNTSNHLSTVSKKTST